MKQESQMTGKPLWPKRHCPECMSTNVEYRKIEFDVERCIAITAYGYCHKCKTHF